MAASEITSNAKEFTNRLSKVGKGYHYQIMLSLSGQMDAIRFQAADNVVPRKVPKPKNYSRISLFKMWKEQPSTPTKLTERTGRLIDVLRSGGNDPSNWHIPKNMQRAVLRNVSRHLLFKIIPQADRSGFHYLATGTLRPTGEVPNMGHRINQEKRGGRKFWEPAAVKVGRRVQPEMFRELKGEWNKTL